MIKSISRLLGRRPVTQPEVPAPQSRPRTSGVRLARRRVQFTGEPAVIYAIGDVHGCLAKLRELEAAIVRDARSIEGGKLLVMLGDHIDRGPDSAGVIDHLLAPPPAGLRRVSLAGNHEALLLDVIDGGTPLKHWLTMGGDATLKSYGIDYAYLERELHPDDLAASIRVSIPPEHLDLLRDLSISITTPNYFFVHAGIRPGVPLPDQTEEDMMWIRREFLHADLGDETRTIIHGHTPVSAVQLGRRINVDTGACMGGALSAVKITRAGISVMQV